MERFEPVPVTHYTECVLWTEALSWIAFRQFGEAIGPQPATSLLIEDWLSNLSAELESKRELASELLIEKASQSKIRVIAGYSADRMPLVMPNTAFVTCHYHDDDGLPIFKSDTEYYDDLVVLAEDLEQQFPSPDYDGRISVFSRPSRDEIDQRSSREVTPFRRSGEEFSGPHIRLEKGNSQE